MQLKNKVAVITGGNSGIGLATAQRFVKEGAHVFITGRRQDQLDRAVELIGRDVTAVQGDVSKLEDLDRLYATVAREKSKIDILFANAGIVEHLTIDQFTPDHFDRTFDINVRGLVFTVQKALPLMNDGGSIVLNASIFSMKGPEAHSAYAASKAAVRSLARSWTMDLRKRGIRVNTLSPGPIDTPIIDGQADTPEKAAELRALFATMVPLGRMGRADEIAAAALFLASGESSFVAGVELCVDGGMAQV